MGRPLRKDVNGVDVLASFTLANAGIRVPFFDTALRSDGVLIKQRGARTFVVCRVGDLAGNKGKDSTNTEVCKTTNATPSAAGQVQIQGYVNTNSGTAVNLRKLTKRLATDFTGTRYKWQLVNDSSNDYIVLTAL